MMIQAYFQEIPDGLVRDIHPVKAGSRVVLDNDAEGVLPDYVLFEPRFPITLKVGDRVEKQKGTFIYRVNSRNLTDFTWMIKYHFLKGEQLFFFFSYITLAIVFVLVFRNRHPRFPSMTS